MCNDEVKIVNPKQVARYMKYGFMPLRMELGYNDTLVFVYDKVETSEIFIKWVKHEI